MGRTAAYVIMWFASLSHFSHGDFLPSDNDALILHYQFQYIYILKVFSLEAISNATSSMYSMYQICMA